MRYIIVLGILLTSLTVRADDKELMIGGNTAKESLFLFREVQGFDLNISDKEKTATISAAHEFETNSILSVKITGKFDGTDATFATEEGLTNDVTLNLAYTKLIYRPSNDAVEEFATMNLAKKEALKLKYHQCMKKFIDIPADKTLSEVVGELKKNDPAKLQFLITNECSSQYKVLIKLDENLSNFEFAKHYWFIKNEVTYSPGSFKYYDTTTSSFITQNQESLGFGASFGYFDIPSTADDKIWTARRFKFGFSYNKGDSAEASNQKKNICSPLGESETLIECFEAYLEPAIEKKTFVFNTSYAVTFKPTSFLKGLEVDIKLTEVDKRFMDETKDSETERWSVALPFTFFVTEKYDFKAGLSLLWQEKLDSDPVDFDRLTAGLFITKGFDISSL